MIGVFDSGAGGLTVLRKMKELLPETDFVYFGDLRNAPYGSKTPEELGMLTVLGVERLLKAGATRVVSACHSASSSIAAPLFDFLGVKPVDIVEMVGPTVESFKERKNSRILLTGTAATIRSGVYQKAFSAIDMNIDTLPLPNLAGAIEEGTSIPGIKGMIDHAFGKAVGGHDVVILGCTHYPLVKNIFESSAKGVEIFDPAGAVAEEVKSRFAEEGSGSLKFILSRDSKFFRDMVEEFFGEGQVVDIVR